MLLKYPFFQRFCMTRFFSSLSSSMFKYISIQLIFKTSPFQSKNNSYTYNPKPIIIILAVDPPKNLKKMQLILQNTKQLKQARQFIKSLSYVYDSIDKKEKQVYLYISNSYLAIVNDFMNVGVAGYKVCFCKLRKNMYKLRNVVLGAQFQEKGIIFYVDSMLILKLLNTQVESDITQMVMAFPHPDAQGEKQYEMRLAYEADGTKSNFKLFTRLEHCRWPFEDGTITNACIPNSTMTKFLIFPSRFGKQIDYFKKFSEFWLCITHDGISIKRTSGAYVVADQFYKSEQFGEYDFYTLKEALKENIFLNINSNDFFHHMDQSNKQNRKAQARLLIEQEYKDEKYIMKGCYLCLTTVTEKRQIHEFFQVAAKQAIDQGSIARETQRMKPRLKDTKKEENDEDQRIVLNRFYGPEYEETMRNDMIMREGFVRPTEPKEETMTNARKYKIQL